MAGTTGEGDWKGTGQTGGIYCLPRQQARAWIVLRRRTQHERVHDGSIGNKGGWAIKSRIATKMRKREKEGIKNRPLIKMVYKKAGQVNFRGCETVTAVAGCTSDRKLRRRGAVSRAGGPGRRGRSLEAEKKAAGGQSKVRSALRKTLLGKRAKNVLSWLRAQQGSRGILLERSARRRSMDCGPSGRKDQGAGRHQTEAPPGR